MRLSARWRSLLIAIALAAVLLYFALRDVDWRQVLAILGRARPQYIAIVLAALSISTFLRGARWRLLLAADRPVSVLVGFWGVSAGYLGNGFLPARAGELLRTALVARRTGIATTYVLATALAERIIDAIVLALILAVVLATLAEVPSWLVVAGRAGAILGVIGLLGLLVLPFFEGLALAILRRLPLPPAIGERLATLVERFLLGLRAVHSLPRMALFLGLTAAVWLIDATAMIICASGFDLTVTYRIAFLMLSALGLASAAPSTPGYVGIYQSVAVGILPMFGFSTEAAIALILAVQGTIYLTIIPWGLLGLWRLSVGRPSEA
jgi:uncharacterized protein (TIRG00374 family)